MLAMISWCFVFLLRVCFVALVRSQDAAKSEVRHTGVVVRAAPGAGAVVQAVILRAQEGAAFGHALLRVGFAGIVAARRPRGIVAESVAGEFLVLLCIVP